MIDKGLAAADEDVEAAGSIVAAELNLWCINFPRAQKKKHCQRGKTHNERYSINHEILHGPMAFLCSQ